MSSDVSWQRRLALHRQAVDPEAADVQQAMVAIAGLGGHSPRGGDPLVLGRGMQHPLRLEPSWRAREQAEM